MKTITERTAATLAWIDSQIALCNAATDGPWNLFPHPHDDCNAVAICGNEFCGSAIMAYLNPEANSAFIAAARTGYPAMLESMKVAIKTLESIHRQQVNYTLAERSAKSLETILAKVEALQ